MPLRDNLAYGRPDVTDAELESVARAVDAHEFVERLDDGYDTVVGERGYTLSGGQRQRISLGRALLMDPPVLVLDDSTSAIDVEVEARIHDELRSRRSGRTTVLIAHRLSTITLADRVVLLDQGRILADGTHAGLLDTVPRYREILASTVVGHAEDRAAAEDGSGP